MTQYYWIGSVGPLIFDETAKVKDKKLRYDGVAAPDQAALVTNGQVIIGGEPTEDEHVLRFIDYLKLIKISNVTLGVGQTDIAVGVELTDCSIEIIYIQSAAAETLEMITGARAGNIKIVIPVNDNVSIGRDDTKIKLKQPLAGPTFDMDTADVVALLNVGGDPDTTTDGTWLELWRSLQT